MGRFLDRCFERIELLALPMGEVGRFDGIGLAHVRRRGDQRDLFRRTIEESLRLLREHDPRRYARIKRHIRVFRFCHGKERLASRSRP